MDRQQCIQVPIQMSIWWRWYYDEKERLKRSREAEEDEWHESRMREEHLRQRLERTRQYSDEQGRIKRRIEGIYYLAWADGDLNTALRLAKNEHAQRFRQLDFSELGPSLPGDRERVAEAWKADLKRCLDLIRDLHEQERQRREAAPNFFDVD